MKDFARFLFVVGIVLFAMFLLWFALYSYGEGRPKGQYQTDVVLKLLSQAPIEVDKQIPLDTSKSLGPFAMVSAYFKDKWLVRSQVAEVTLSQLYEKFPKTLFFVDVTLDQTTDSAALTKVLDRNENWQRTVIVSRSDGMLEDLRKLSPKWTFSSGEVFLARFLSLSSLGLQSLVDIPGDIFYLTNRDDLSQSETQRLVDEALRQKKLILVETKNSHLSNPDIHAYINNNSTND